ncbi:hypothetical protein T265_03047 [Opisthorchis viverrini]|uniref:Beta-1,4-galactosyltransferase n=1 Tax=Opisthorchis viverrini TaxID=6198 RepID=A0A075A4R6_OPIVI|nr:hypothetical protein T265_03047 [Opisthorchis viverrini]KER30570.1 hypothetical protein T265_03047 [Opisthorchis viverrini]
MAARHRKGGTAERFFWATGLLLSNESSNCFVLKSCYLMFICIAIGHSFRLDLGAHSQLRVAMRPCCSDSTLNDQVFTLPSVRALKFCCISTSLLCVVLLLITFLRRDLAGHRYFKVAYLNPWTESRTVITSQPSLPRILPLDVPCPVPPSSDSVGAITVSLEPPSWDSLLIKYVESESNRSLANLVTPLVPSSTVAVTRTSSDSGIVYSLGVWSPIECSPKQTVAVILPYRARDEHLRIFLNHMHGFFRHQRLRYTIFVIEQLGTTHFNRAALFNIGFLESTRVAHFDCFIFHDVDLLPQDDRIPYQCGKQPIHLSVAVDKFGYRLLYEQLFGGAVAFSREQFVRVRGFSNVYFGWGGEDDDMFGRVRHAGYYIFRHSNQVSRYTMIKHSSEKLNEKNEARYGLLKEASKRFANDGYPESLYTVVSAGPRYGGLVYWVSIHLAEEKIRQKYHLKR